MNLAYLDAGSGSLIVQALVGGVAGVAVAAKLYWRRLTGRFRRQPAPRAAEQSSGGQSAGSQSFGEQD
ncbi:hypothetical protein [Plantactinospora sp. B5E13]|uniref:hypothetical protein n=1 Tax=unclassified Plantactinospora TaxID=2631981 RepID=UPI00325D378B